MLTGPRADIFGKFFSNDANVSLVDEIRTERAVPASREYLFMLARVLLAVFAALALAFLLEYLDDTVPGGAALEKVVGLPLLAEIPGASDGRGGRGGSLS